MRLHRTDSQFTEFPSWITEVFRWNFDLAQDVLVLPVPVRSRLVFLLHSPYLLIYLTLPRKIQSSSESATKWCVVSKSVTLAQLAPCTPRRVNGISYGIWLFKFISTLRVSMISLCQDLHSLVFILRSRSLGPPAWWLSMSLTRKMVKAK